MFERFTEPGIKVVVTAQEEARRIGNNFVGTEQILIGLVAETVGIGGRILRKYGVTLRLVRLEIQKLVGKGSGFVAVEIPFTPRARRVLENAIEEAKILGFPYVGPEHILLGILMEDSGIAITALRKILKDVNGDGVTFEDIRKRTINQMSKELEAEVGRTLPGAETRADRERRERRENGQIDVVNNPEALEECSPKELHPNFDPKSPLLSSPILNEFCTNLTQLAFAGKVDPVIGRDTEVQRTLQILSRRRKNNPLLIGEPGVGKTAVAEGLALQIISGNVPTTLQGKNIIALDMGLLIAGSRYRGDFEKRLKRVINDLTICKCYILLIDEVHTLVGAGAAEGSLDAANILKPSLARGEFQCIGATTIAEFNKHIESDKALARRFQKVMVDEPSIDDAVTILTGIRDKYELHHNVQITQNALEEAASLSKRYISDRYLPDSAIDLIDEACARVRLGYEQIPTMCSEFEAVLTSICTEKDAAYADNDWVNGLSLLREEIKFVQQFLKFIYELFNTLKNERRPWVIRGLQERYQFILRGTRPLLKEWDILVSLYDNERMLDSLATQDFKGKQEQVVQLEKSSTELEEELNKYRTALQNLPEQDFISSPPLERRGVPMEYDLTLNPTNSDYDEMNPFVDQELENIQKEIQNLAEVEGIDELQKKFDEREIGFASDDSSKNTKIADKTESQNQIKKDENLENSSLSIEEVENDSILDKRKMVSMGKSSERNDLEYADDEFVIHNEVTMALVKQINSSESAKNFRNSLAELELPFDKKKVPYEVAAAVQKRLFTNLFTPFSPLIDRSEELNEFLAEESELNNILEITPDINEEPDVELQNLENFVKRQKSWCLFSFVIWNTNLLEYDRKKQETESIKTNDLKKRKKSDSNQNYHRPTEPKIKNQIPIGINQIGFELIQLYKKEGLILKLGDVDLTVLLEFRNLFHEAAVERMGKAIIEKFGYEYTTKNENPISQSQNLEKSEFEFSELATKWINDNPNWLEMDPDEFVEAIKNLPEDTDAEKFLVKDIKRRLDKMEKWKERGLELDDLQIYWEVHNQSMEYFTEKAKYLREIKFKGFENNPAQIKKLEQEKKAQKIKLEEASQQIMQNAVYENVPYVPWVFSNDVEKVISEWTGIPVSRVSKDESSRLLQIETELQKRVIGQRDAVEAIAKAIRRSRMGLRDLNRPIASLFFSGPTGVGKTEVTKALAASYFGGESDMVRFDMSEFQERHTTAKLIGSPPGYIGYNEGGQLTEAVRRKPYIVVLFDEVEKAHPDVFNVLLQVLDDGRLSDSQGRVCDFKNTIVIMTSNLGSSAIQDKFKELEKDTDPDNFNLDNDLDEQGNEKTANEQMKEFVLEELKGFFRPEFLNRIDEIVVFNTLRKNDIRKIASIMLKKLKQRLATKQYYLLFGETILDAVVDEGYDPTYGARPLRRVITNRIEDKVAAAILENGISPNSTIWVTYVSNEYRIYHNEPSFDKFSEKSYS